MQTGVYLMLQSNSNVSKKKTFVLVLATAECTGQGGQLACHPEVQREAFNYSWRHGKSYTPAVNIDALVLVDRCIIALKPVDYVAKNINTGTFKNICTVCYITSYFKYGKYFSQLKRQSFSHIL